MGAFSIAFDIIIVGALALPWVLLVIHLFFSDNESSLKKLLGWVESQNQPAVAGVLLFAMTFSLGSAVSRMAQDFFDDDDLHFRAFQHLFQVGVTESSIRTEVYCQTFQRDGISTTQTKEAAKPPGTDASKHRDPTAAKRQAFTTNDPSANTREDGSSGRVSTAMASGLITTGSATREIWPETFFTSTKPPFC